MTKAPYLLALALSLAACRTGELPPGGVAALDGYWEGEAAVSLGLSACPRLTPYAMTIRNGDIEGVVRNPNNHTVVSANFYGFVDTDGTLTTSARTMAEDIAIRGRFETATRFVGETKGRDCTTRLRLEKKRPL